MFAVLKRAREGEMGCLYVRMCMRKKRRERKREGKVCLWTLGCTRYS